ncbi:HEAT repeat domain-containing protein [uncultured Draconibacterium sp.]|uniref:HEAT repeat domain-containing protein n=1 Tax=uncultured Draconibacterium sp. TaxID=1573823 RepID=UPI0025EC4C59|nr:HEAT repeat domain-containing protein [uncultured Draconibacterium sp.]
MKTWLKYLLVIILSYLVIPAFCQNREAEIDSLVEKMRTVHKDWSSYSEALVRIGEPAVPALIENALNKDLKPWNRRISMVTLNNIHSALWVEPALQILFDEEEPEENRNRVTAGLVGFDLSEVKQKLWARFVETENQFYKSNMANLLMTADTALAYRAFFELYHTQDGHIRRNALQKLVQLRQNEATNWYVKALVGTDWMTANLAMDSLINAAKPDDRQLMAAFYATETNEEVKWRIVYVFGERKNIAYIPFLCQALKHNSWLVRTEAAVGLLHFEKDLVIDEINSLQTDSLPGVRENANWVLSRLKASKF